MGSASSNIARTTDRDFSALSFRISSRFSLEPCACFRRALRHFDDGAFFAFSILSHVFLNS